MAGGPTGGLGTGEWDLRQALAVVRTFPPAEACRLGAQLARVLAAVHATGGVHAGLCAAEIRFPDERHRLVRLGPPGRAWVDRPAPPWAPPGLHAYTAPEVVAGAAPSAAADLYALGALLHELSAGAPPFSGDPEDMMRRQVRDLPVRPAGVPDQLWVLIAALLAKDPTDRPGPAGQIARYLDSIAAVVSAVPPAPPPADRRDSAFRAEPTPIVMAPPPAPPAPVVVTQPEPAVDTSVVISEPERPVVWELPPRNEVAPWERPARDDFPWDDPPAVPTPVLPAVLARDADETTVLPVISAPLAPDPGPAVLPMPPSMPAPVPEVPLRLVVPAQSRRDRQRSTLLVLSAVVPVLLLFGVVRWMSGGEAGEGATVGAAEEGTVDPAAGLTQDQGTVQPGVLATPAPAPTPTATPATLEQQIAALAELASRNGGAVVDAEIDGLYREDDLAADGPYLPDYGPSGDRGSATSARSTPRPSIPTAARPTATPTPRVAERSTTSATARSTTTSTPRTVSSPAPTGTASPESTAPPEAE